jgi:hypothetical protein
VIRGFSTPLFIADAAPFSRVGSYYKFCRTKKEMNRSAWRQPTSADVAYRRAAGRRAYNMQREIVAMRRRERLAKMLGGYAPTRGELSGVAHRMGVSKATASRDVAQLRRAGALQERMTFARLMRVYKDLV